MSKAEQYQNHADLCRECGAVAPTPESREAWLNLAEEWLSMIPHQGASSPPILQGEESAGGALGREYGL